MSTYNLLKNVQAEDCYNDKAVTAELYIDSVLNRIAFTEGSNSGGNAFLYFKTLQDLKQFSTNLQNAVSEIENAN